MNDELHHGSNRITLEFNPTIWTTLNMFKIYPLTGKILESNPASRLRLNSFKTYPVRVINPRVQSYQAAQIKQVQDYS